MNKNYLDKFKIYTWDSSIIPSRSFKQVMLYAVIIFAIILSGIAVFQDSAYLNGPYGWWPIIPCLGVFVYIAIACSHFKCELCQAKIKFLQIKYDDAFEAGMAQSNDAKNHPPSEWKRCYVQLYICQTCEKQAIGGVTHENDG